MEILLTSKIYEIMKIHKKTKAKMFEYLEVGDIIKFSIPIKRAGLNRGTYASYIKVTNCVREDFTEVSFNQIVGRLKNFDLLEIN